MVWRMTQHHMRFLSSRSLHAVKICIADPRLVLEYADELLAAKTDLSEPAPLITLDMPHDFSSSLSQGRQELGDTDDPHNSWTFGETGEFFQYSYVGDHSCASGWTSIITHQELLKLGRSQHRPRFEDLLIAMESSKTARWPVDGFPFLFAGKILEAPSASVWTLKKGSKLTGLMVSSNAG